MSQIRVEPRYSPWVAWPVESQRLAIMTCLRCGAAVLLDMDNPDQLAATIHNEWHERGRSDG